MKYLIIINNIFPYDFGESFLESEIHIISKYFDKVIVFPISVSDNNQPITRMIPDNAVCWPSDIEKKLNTKLKSSILCLPRLISRKGLEGYLDSSMIEFSRIRTEKIIKSGLLDTINVDDKVFLYSYWFYTYTQIALNINDYLSTRGISQIKVFSRAHGFDVYKERQLLHYFPNREYMLKRINNVYVCSQQGRDYIAREYPLFNDKLMVGRLGTTDRGVCPDKTEHQFVIVSCSSVIPLKQVTLIAKAINCLLEIDKNVVWHHFGNGSEMPKVKRIIKRHLGNNVFLHGNVHNSAIYDFYHNNYVDVFVNASKTEGIPVSIMEAMSFGIPVVAPNVGGVGEIVLEENGCILLNSSISHNDIMEAIIDMKRLTADEMLDNRRKTRLFWEQHYNAVDNYSKFIEQVING